MSQSKKMSAVEIILSTTIGAVVAYISQELIFPLFSIHVSTSENLQLVGYFTAISVVRGYAVRRMFNFIHSNQRSHLHGHTGK